MNQLILEYAIDPDTIKGLSKELHDFILDWRLQLEEDISDIDNEDNPTLNYFITTEEDEREGIFSSRISPMFENIELLNDWFEQNKIELDKALNDLYSDDETGLFTDWIENINKSAE